MKLQLFLHSWFVIIVYCTTTFPAQQSPVPHILTFFFKPALVQFCDSEACQTELSHLAIPGHINRTILSQKLLSPIINGIYVTYAGLVTHSDFNGQVSFPVQSTDDTFTLVVTDALRPVLLFGNTVDHLELVEHNPVQTYLAKRVHPSASAQASQLNLHSIANKLAPDTSTQPSPSFDSAPLRSGLDGSGEYFSINALEPSNSAHPDPSASSGLKTCLPAEALCEGWVEGSSGKTLWEIRKINLPVHNRIPENAIVIVAQPSQIVIIEGTFHADEGPNIILPHVYVTDTITLSTNALQFLKVIKFFDPVLKTFGYARDRYADIIAN